eukprot:321333_1
MKPITVQHAERAALIYCIMSTTYLLMQHNTRDANSGMEFNEVITHSHNQRQLLQSRQIIIDIEPEITIGSIIIWSGSIDTIPQNWALCDGRNNTPNLTDRFVIGAGNTYSMNLTGGQSDIQLSNNQLPKHNHMLNNESIMIDESDDEHYHNILNDGISISLDNGHKHVISTDNISIDGEHYHSAGDYSTSNHGEHVHEIAHFNNRQSGLNDTNSTMTHEASYTIQIDTSSLQISSIGSHTHSASSMYTSSAGNHAHYVGLIVSGVGFDSGMVAGGGNNIGNMAAYAGSHTHNVYGSTNGNGGHTHSMSGSLLLNVSNLSTNSIGSHMHNINGQSAKNGQHGHELYTISDSAGKHSHNIKGKTGWHGDNHTHDVIYGETDGIGNNERVNIMNPYYALAYIIKVSHDTNTLHALEVEDFADYDSKDKDDNISSVLIAIITLVLIFLCIMIICGIYAFKLYKTSKEKETERSDIELNRIKDEEQSDYEIQNVNDNDNDLIAEINDYIETGGNNVLPSTQEGI